MDIETAGKKFCPFGLANSLKDKHNCMANECMLWTGTGCGLKRSVK